MISGKWIVGILIILLVAGGFFALRSAGGRESLPPLPQPIPSLTRAIKIPASFPKDAGLVMVERFRQLRDALAKDPRSVDNWIQLGNEWKTIEDYEGARESWEYALKLRPNHSVPLTNLGDLYGYYLHDPKKAEAYYEQALQNGKGEPALVQKVADFRRDVLKK